MAEQENPVFGRKVFFLNLSSDLRNQIIDPLREREYEVFNIDDYKSAKAILRNFPDAICFVQVDIHGSNQLKTNQWFNFLHSFQSDPVLKTIYLGVITKRMTTSEQNFFMLNLLLPAGLLSIRNGTDELFDNLINILEVNGAKGRRQYVRAKCPENSRAVVRCKIADVTVIMTINDISSVGISCYIKNNQTQLFKPNIVLENISFSINSATSFHCNAAVFTVKPFNNQYSLLVLLLMKGTTRAVKTEIRQYIFNILEHEIQKKVQNIPLDATEYSEKIDLQADEGFLLDANETEETETV